MRNKWILFVTRSFMGLFECIYVDPTHCVFQKRNISELVTIFKLPVTDFILRNCHFLCPCA